MTITELHELADKLREEWRNGNRVFVFEYNIREQASNGLAACLTAAIMDGFDTQERSDFVDWLAAVICD